MAKQSNKAVWVRSLFSALISGGAGALGSSSSAIVIAPESFNFQDGLSKTLALAGASAVIGAITGVSNFLKQSPLPPAEDESAAPPPAEPKA